MTASAAGAPGGAPAPGGGPAAYECRPAWAEIDLAAITHNASVLAARAAPAALCAVVKAGGYGHGPVQVARAALAGGATWLAVALVEEGRDLRAAGVDVPILVLSEPPPAAMAEVVASGLTPTVYTGAGLEAVSAEAARSGAGRTGPPFPVHVKVDTGMHRVGASTADAVALAGRVDADPHLHLDGFWTHFAVSDEVEDPFTGTQIDRFADALRRLEASGVRPRVRHAANSGGTLWHRDSHFDMVRCGISLYGLAPADDGPGRPAVPDLRPAMSLKAHVSFVKTVAAGERLSYGRRYAVRTDSVVATVPLGYADGIPRRLFADGGQVLIGGRRRPIAGTVTMDQILVDCGPDAPVQAGDEVVLIGRQGDESISAWEWAAATGTIAYEVVCGISGRVPRVYIDGSWPAG
ncbi:MAG TPA: alanine racemase [Acidimicrobiales bacterium]|nr:alanine racemase [Acidimicrobiales bacterium]